MPQTAGIGSERVDRKYLSVGADLAHCCRSRSFLSRREFA
jgi:hypothetical protein